MHRIRVKSVFTAATAAAALTFAAASSAQRAGDASVEVLPRSEALVVQSAGSGRRYQVFTARPARRAFRFRMRRGTSP